MSSALEPPTTAKVILHTTKGPVEVELWAKETPKACRNFLQLCLDGTFDNTIFHRVVPGFLVQGGDPTGTGHGGTSIYDDEGGFETEAHSRLRFNRRGLLGNADAEKMNDNSQFFITLAATPELQGKHTMFGRIMGDTIFNVLKIGEAELDNNDRPLYPTKITKVEIVVNYFDDMKPRRSESTAASKSSSDKKKKKAKPKVKMSFADDEVDEDDGDGGDAKRFKMKPAHEILNDSRLSNQPAVGADDITPPPQVEPLRIRKKKSSSSSSTEKPKASNTSEKTETPPQRSSKSTAPQAIDDGTQSLNQSFDQVSNQKSEFDRINEEIIAMKSSLKRKAAADDESHEAKKKASSSSSSLLEEERQKYLQKQSAPTSSKKSKKKQLEEREAATLAMLSKFTTKLHTASSSNPAPPALPRKSSKRKITEPKSERGQEKGEEEERCDLHNLVNCQSCLYYDQLSGDEDDDPESLMTHTFEDTKSVRVAADYRARMSPPPVPPTNERRHRTRR
ncbi:cyclophilin-like domain-containing protein [Myxozyma melibiosi]|uniref:Cyclophilin-like domain-containing protein n=1 Tax=Myxozyma melibiosi TaxID=54550 RepID=A0ABR1F0U7_9ASCO